MLLLNITFKMDPIQSHLLCMSFLTKLIIDSPPEQQFIAFLNQTILPLVLSVLENIKILKYTYCDTTKSCCLLPKPLQKPLPHRDAYHCRNLENGGEK